MIKNISCLDTIDIIVDKVEFNYELQWHFTGNYGDTLLFPHFIAPFVVAGWWMGAGQLEHRQRRRQIAKE